MKRVYNLQHGENKVINRHSVNELLVNLLRYDYK